MRDISKTRPIDHEELLRSFADATRQKLLQILLREEFNVTELVEILNQPQSTVSRHLKVLRAAGLIKDRREGTTALYSAAATPENDGELSHVLVRWVGQLPFSAAFQRRLDSVLNKRRNDAVSFFERLGNRWDELRNAAFGDAFSAEAFISLLPAEWTVADLGAGTGFLLPALANQFHRVLAVEPSSAMLECARHRIAEHGVTNVVLHQGDLGQLPIQDAVCDLAVACLVLHHVPEPDAALAEMHRILRPNGRLLVVEQQTHENHAFHEMMQDQWRGFSPSAMAKKMHKVGFRAIRHRLLTMTKAPTEPVGTPRLFVVTGEKTVGKQDL